MKFIFVTGGVMSGLGKGVTASSIGRLMKSCGRRVNMIKIDPYLHVDAGTMSPISHGEVFVTDDGGETDLDIGNYERFLDESLTGKNNITTGQVYLSVIHKEREGAYLGQNVQIIPHITNEIKDNIKTLSKDYDLTIIEVGGTVGDIESLPFLEAIRQFKTELGRENTIFVHVVPLLKVSTSGELKTKAIQHSVIKLRELGIQADFLVCRAEESFNSDVRKKLSLFCDIQEDHIIEAVNQESIYQVPLAFKEQEVHTLIQKHFHEELQESNLTQRENRINQMVFPKKEVTIAIAGKYVQLEDSYLSVIEAVKHAGAYANTKIHIEWIDTEKYEDSNRENNLENFIDEKGVEGIIVPGGFGGRGIEGMINIANYARTHNFPYLGICLGLQIAVISFARNVCGLKDAHSTEFNKGSTYPVIDIMEHQKTITNKGGTMRLGSYPAILKEGTKIYTLYDQKEITERHRHRFEVNPDFHNTLETNGMVISGTSPDGKLVEFIEIPENNYYVATQAHPEFKSRLDKPHPLFVGLVEAAIKNL